ASRKLAFAISGSAAIHSKSPQWYRLMPGFSVSLLLLTFKELAHDDIRCRSFAVDRVGRGDRGGLRRQQLSADRGTARPDSRHARRIGEARERTIGYGPAGGEKRA